MLGRQLHSHCHAARHCPLATACRCVTCNEQSIVVDRELLLIFADKKVNGITPVVAVSSDISLCTCLQLAGMLECLPCRSLFEVLIQRTSRLMIVLNYSTECQHPLRRELMTKACTEHVHPLFAERKSKNQKVCDRRASIIAGEHRPQRDG
jgi:hypothetical protein